jgi:hypothetical protein
LKDPNINPSARVHSLPLTKVIAAVSDIQATKSVAMEAKLISQVDELKSIQTKEEYQDQPKLKVDIADFKAKLRELDRLNARTADEAVRAKEEAETQCIAHTKELQKTEATLWSISQPVSAIQSQISQSILKKQISSTVPKKDRGDQQRSLGAEKSLPGEQPEGGSKAISLTSNGRNKIGRLHKFKRNESPGTWEIPSTDESDGRLNLLAKSLVVRLRSIHNNDAIGTNPDASFSINAAITNYDIASSNNNAASDNDHGICSSTEYSSSYASSFDRSIEVDEHESETTATRESSSTIDSNSESILFSVCDYQALNELMCK